MILYFLLCKRGKPILLRLAAIVNCQVFSVKQVEGYTRVIVTGSNNERISKFE